jgi:hypothetical protein
MTSEGSVQGNGEVEGVKGVEGEGDGDGTVFLDDTWSLYFHDPLDSDWTLNSYTKICNVSSANDFWGAHAAIGANIAAGMFFIMREHVFPCWDDKYNIDGGCVSIKVPREAVSRTWRELCVDMLSEAMQTPGSANDVNGLSVSPKHNFCIIKLWTAGQGMREEAARPALLRGSSFFRSNMESLRGEQPPAPAAPGLRA